MRSMKILGADSIPVQDIGGHELEESGMIGRFHHAKNESLASEWAATFMTRYMPAAVACGHLTLPDALAFFDKIMKMMEQFKEESFHLGLVYETLARHSWMERAEARDPDLDIAKECKTVNKTLLDTARMRLKPTLSDAKLDGGTGSAPVSYRANLLRSRRWWHKEKRRRPRQRELT